MLAYSVCLRFSHEMAGEIDLEEWTKRSMEWLHQTFDHAGDGKSNVISAVLHMDESTPHIHAVIVPIDERGRLNASRYTDGSRVFSEMHTSYAKTLEGLGLERGVKGSQAKETDIRKFYGEFQNYMTPPEPLENETAEEYRERAMDDLTALRAASFREQKEREQESLAYLDKQTDLERAAVTEYAETVLIRAAKKKKQIIKEVSDLEERSAELRREIIKYNLGDLSAEEIASLAKEMKDLQDAIDTLRKTDPEYAEEVQMSIQEVKELAQSGPVRGMSEKSDR